MRKLVGKSEKLPNSPKTGEVTATTSTATLETTTAPPDVDASNKKQPVNLSNTLEQAEIWLNRVELLQSLFGNYVPASLDDLVTDDAAKRLRDRLIEEERFNMAIHTCHKCKVTHNTGSQLLYFIVLVL